jgi:hypothetical protein
MIRKSAPGDEPPEKRTTDDARKLSSRAIDSELEKRLLEAGGFSRKQLYNRRGGHAEKGLALLLDPGDQITDVLPGQARIRTREGTLQTFYNLERSQDFLLAVPAGSQASGGSEQGAGGDGAGARDREEAAKQGREP